jgi:hypothetical protein
VTGEIWLPLYVSRGCNLIGRVAVSKTVSCEGSNPSAPAKGGTVTTREELSQWLDEMYSNKEYTHMIVFCDTFDYEDYPVFVSKDEDLHGTIKAHESDFNRVMEVYSAKHPKSEQLMQRRVLNFD